MPTKPAAIVTVLIFAMFLWIIPAASGQTMTVGFLAGSGGLGDESFNDMTYKGLGRAKLHLDIDIKVREWEPDRDMEKLLLELAAFSPELIVLNGDQFSPLIDKYAPIYPDIHFLANDFDAGRYPNVKSIVYSQHEGAFLAGALAAMFSRSKKIGFCGGVDIEVIKAYRTGFSQGANHVTDNIEIMEEYISRTPDFSGFNNPKKAYEMALELYDNGVDVIFAAAGSSGNGVIQAAKKRQLYVIGVDSNQDHMAKGHVLTSVMKRLDTAVYAETVNVYLGDFQPGTVWYGLDSGGISLTPMEYTRHIIPLSMRQSLEKLKRKIITGEITVTNSLVEHGLSSKRP